MNFKSLLVKEWKILMSNISWFSEWQTIKILSHSYLLWQGIVLVYISDVILKPAYSQKCHVGNYFYLYLHN